MTLPCYLYWIKDFGGFIFGLGLCEAVNLKHLQTMGNVAKFSLHIFNKIFYTYSITSNNEEAEIPHGLNKNKKNC